jgi:hypothetical protein
MTTHLPGHVNALMGGPSGLPLVMKRLNESATPRAFQTSSPTRSGTAACIEGPAIAASAIHAIPPDVVRLPCEQVIGGAQIGSRDDTGWSFGTDDNGDVVLTTPMLDEKTGALR